MDSEQWTDLPLGSFVSEALSHPFFPVITCSLMTASSTYFRRISLQPGAEICSSRYLDGCRGSGIGIYSRL